MPLLPIVQRLAELGGRIHRHNQAELLLTPAGRTYGARRPGRRPGAPARRAAPAAAPPVADAVVARGPPAGGSRRGRPRVDAAGLDDAALRELIGVESDAAADRLDPDAGTVLQAVWFDRGPGERGRLLLVAHHLVVDGVSWRILTDDLRDGATAARPPAPGGTSLRAYARLLHEQAGQAARLGEFETLGRRPRPRRRADAAKHDVGLTAGADPRPRAAPAAE